MGTVAKLSTEVGEGEHGVKYFLVVTQFATEQSLWLERRLFLQRKILN